MTKETILKIHAIYKKKLSNYSKQMYPYGRLLSSNYKIDVLKHALAMIDRIEKKFLIQNKMERVLVWHGFIQACLWITGKYTIQQLKRHNRL